MVNFRMVRALRGERKTGIRYTEYHPLLFLAGILVLGTLPSAPDQEYQRHYC